MLRRSLYIARATRILADITITTVNGCSGAKQTPPRGSRMHRRSCNWRRFDYDFPSIRTGPVPTRDVEAQMCGLWMLFQSPQTSMIKPLQASGFNTSESLISISRHQRLVPHRQVLYVGHPTAGQPRDAGSIRCRRGTVEEEEASDEIQVCQTPTEPHIPYGSTYLLRR